MNCMFTPCVRAGTADENPGGVICEIPGSNIPEGLNLQTGKELTIKGQCTGFLMDVVLVKCVLVE